MNSILSVQDLCLWYGSHQALKDINIEIPEKSITALIGPSGCGKSTFLKTLDRMNDLIPDVKITGSIKYKGEDIFEPSVDVSELRRQVGMVFQKPNPFPMSIYDNIAYGPRTHGVKSRAKLDEIVEQSLRGEEMRAAIAQAREEGDSVGGVIECAVFGAPAGLGDPMFGGMENRIAAAIFGIPAVKGIEFGAGFGAAKLRGSENNDAFSVENGRIVTETNRCGGILGGITDGMPIVLRAAFKPTPSIARTQQSVNLQSVTREELAITGRHDPCIVPRAVPCVEAAVAVAVYDALLARRKETR